MEWSGNPIGGLTAHITPCKFLELYNYIEEKQRKLIKEQEVPMDDEDEEADMTCEHRWRSVLDERQGQTYVHWQMCDKCGARRVVSSYLGAKGECQEEHLWPEHVPEAVEEAMRREEAVDHPSHYRKDSGFEAIDVIEAWDLDFCLGNALKYICRAGLKANAVEDLEKAEWYLRHEIERRRKDGLHRD